jgi:hypothetical protein
MSSKQTDENGELPGDKSKAQLRAERRAKQVLCLFFIIASDLLKFIFLIIGSRSSRKSENARWRVVKTRKNKTTTNSKREAATKATTTTIKTNNIKIKRR